MRTEVIEQLRREGIAGGWSPEIGERAGYKCEYCGKDMLASVNAWNCWETDHIIPQYDPDGPGDTFENYALACHSCNFCIKRMFNPADEVGYDASRDELIRASRAYIEKQSDQIEKRLLRCREIVGWQGAARDAAHCGRS